MCHRSVLLLDKLMAKGGIGSGFQRHDGDEVKLYDAEDEKLSLVTLCQQRVASTLALSGSERTKFSVPAPVRIKLVACYRTDGRTAVPLTTHNEIGKR